MIPAETIRKLFTYYYWARDEQLEACEALSEEQWTRDLGNSFASVRDTFHHILIAEWAWNRRWRNGALDNVPDPNDVPTVAALRERWQPIEADTKNFLAGLDHDRQNDGLNKNVTFTNMQGNENTCALWETFYHLLNHQSYHRGQITTMLRQLGADAPSVDYATRYLQHIQSQA